MKRPICYLTIKSYNLPLMNAFCNRLVEISNKIEIINFNSIIHLPTKIKKYTVIRSPFIDKKSREQFELREYKKVLSISKINPKSFDVFLKIIYKHIPFGISLKIVRRYKKLYI